jgi:ubiquinone/menaquinone biosynthesis C-methylase UbiE
MVPVLLRRASRVTGIDASAAMVAEAGLATAAFGVREEVREGSVERLDARDGAYDTAVCWRLLHHLTEADDRRRVLRELARVARRAVVVSFADAGTWKARGERLRGRRRRQALRSVEELAAEAAEAGLRLERTWRLSSAFSLLAAALLRPEARGAAPPTGRSGR